MNALTASAPALPASRSCRLTAALIIALSGLTCTTKGDESGTPEGALSDEPGGTLVIAIPGDARSLYPPTTESALDFAVIHSIFDRLAAIGPELNTNGDVGFEPRLADSWQWAPDSMSIAFALNPNAKFHDGYPVRAEDVRFTFRAYTDTTGQSVNNAYLSNIDSVSAKDSLTAVFWFKRRTPQQFFDATYPMYILPSHLLSGLPIQSLGTDSVTSKVIGSGRFRFAGRTQQQSIEMISDTGNYRKRAKVDRVVWAVKANVQTAALSVFDGTADFFEKLQPDDLDKVPKNPNLKIVPYVQAGYSYLGFNLRSASDNTKPNPFFSDVRVRRALTMAVNRTESARAVLDSFAKPAIGPAPRMMFSSPDSLKQIAFDVVHARALLDSAGWVLDPGKTVRTKDGTELAFDLILPNTSRPRIAYADLLVQQFRGIGVAATSRILDRQAMLESLDLRKFDAYIGAWTVTPGLKGLPQAWSSSGIRSQNYGSYSDPKFDADINAALNSLVPAKASALWTRAFQEIIDEAPAIFLYEERSIGLMQKRVQPRRMRADAWYSDLADWTIDPKKFGAKR